MTLEEQLRSNPVIATLFGEEGIDAFRAAPTRFCLVANLELHRVAEIFGEFKDESTFPILNVDSVPGLAANADGLEFLRRIEVPGIVSTHSQTVVRAPSCGMLSLQKVFVTDRSNLGRAMASIKQSRAHIVQLMPWPVVPYLDREFLDEIGPFIVSGFVNSPEDVERALDLGALAVSTSQQELWSPA